MTNLEKGKKVVTIAYGCQMSERDAETLTEITRQEGYQSSEELENADLVILNTCCVRESAENRILGKIGELKKLKERNPHLKIAISGCMVQQPGAVERLRKRAPFIDIWTGTHNLHNFSDLLHQVEQGGKVAEVWTEPKLTLESTPLAEKGKLQANVNIMYGCDNFCSYCIVPHVRGRERSRKPEEIIQEIKDLVDSGCREVTLLGQNVNSYGKEFSPAYDFADLLKDVDQIADLLRIRFITSHPKDLSDKLIETVAEGQKLCEHFHLPIQSGSNFILQRMNRKYTREYYLSRVEKIYELLPQARITTDVIVGFPGESEEDFEQTLEIMNLVHYSHAFTFMYSKRSGTLAAEMENQIALDVKKRRLQKLMSVQNQQSLVWRQKMIGKTYEVLVEGPSRTNPERLTGRTRGYELAVFNGHPELIGSLVNVKILDAGSWTLTGEIERSK
ncbi:tRNA (N6-isopentenyl adenosine(37)-C2)-methylthiotransferase MiaB [Desulfosporosinus sp. BICA1-9]|uniref:tRNA (N6-isopentenyl adenosine(37)-C2)-methylthiotransferase MiaB n=1 Tax=Desulfosporosinus sp. BICA1-9 TaxID=1531958 RepID=UPI00054B3D80|nr:tRNA (N6-isopentenyl adenosine(37)-C2)-methylthiotransferase MiaB [Desulfosporosinus sp. BICA1-9]KJS47235.1 MAG: dimethylallyladenosine tRNA methylthiotransferase [Peptococcaceae bacterium BRH_c23]KJS88490.1 MAG: dimethylallyladenosine tRNA methylthiotransferase [Desulfosporosinus sp. BICA1-9]HBW34661.1 tRNA (N6-isopentenyl adenosine(37)-C2)-methylthiotransferase MiaB [Desulfosporosinus sp.]